MKVEVFDEGFLIVPETDFEEQYLHDKFSDDEDQYVVYHKTGLTPADYLGVKIVKK